LILIYNQTVYTASVGDSRAVIAYHNKENSDNLNSEDILVMALTEDHKPDNPQEKVRIEAAGEI
jgi:serine/threonine protein phosphatase PrpC